jgi:hypothetical protein
VATEEGVVWAFGQGAHGRLSLNDEGDRLVPTRMDPQRFGGAYVATVAAGAYHSAAVTEGGALFTWGVGRWHGLAEELAPAFAMGTHARLGRDRQRGQAAVVAVAEQGPGGGRGRQGMSVLYDAGGSGKAGGGGVKVGGGEDGGGGSAAADWGWGQEKRRTVSMDEKPTVWGFGH